MSVVPRFALSCFGACLAVRLVLLAAAAPAAQGAGGRPTDAIRARNAPAYVRLFAPPAHQDAYRAYVSPMPVDAVVRTLEHDVTLLRPPGAWEVKAVSPGDAFGGPGATDRWKLARLYGARSARVARGPRVEGGRVSESWTLISPYPDPSLTRLEPGTLILVLRLPR